MATYDFTNSWDTETYTKDGNTYSFTQSDYSNAINAATTTAGVNKNGEPGHLAPGGPGGSHSSDLMASFGSSYGSGEVDLLNFVDFDYSDNGASEWTAMNDILGDSNTVGGYATAIDAEGEGFIQVKSNFNGYNTFLSSDAGYTLAEDKLFDLWHLDGLADGDYVTAQIIGSDTTLTDANLSVWGEIDGYMTEGSPDMLSWPYIEHDAIAIDSFNMAGDHSLGDFTYTMNIVTDWKDCSASDYESFDWGYMNYSGMSTTEFSDMNWGYIEYDEFTTSSYTDIDWGVAEFDEFESSSYTSMDWGYVQYSEFNSTSYTSLNWGSVEYGEISTSSYTELNWGSIEYGEFSASSYTDIDWGYAEFDEFGEEVWDDLNWGSIEYDEFSASSYTDIDWGYAEFDEFGEEVWDDLDWGEVQYKEFDDSSYTSVDWGQVQYKEFENNDYKDAAWNKVEMKEFEKDDYKKIDWGKVEYKEVLKSSDNLNDVDWGKVQTNEWDKGDLKILMKGSTAKKLDNLEDTELDINVLKKGKSFKGDKDDDVITTSGKLLKKKVNVKGGAGNDTFVLKKGNGSMVIQDFKDKKDEINFAYCGSAKKIKLKQKGKDTLIYSGKDLLATVKKTKKNVLKKSAFGLV